MAHTIWWLNSSWEWMAIGLALFGSILPFGSARKERRS